MTETKTNESHETGSRRPTHIAYWVCPVSEHLSCALRFSYFSHTVQLGLERDVMRQLQMGNKPARLN